MRRPSIYQKLGGIMVVFYEHVIDLAACILRYSELERAIIDAF